MKKWISLQVDTHPLKVTTLPALVPVVHQRMGTRISSHHKHGNDRESAAK